MKYKEFIKQLKEGISIEEQGKHEIEIEVGLFLDLEIGYNVVGNFDKDLTYDTQRVEDVEIFEATIWHNEEEYELTREELDDLKYYITINY